jgi:excisionase family DNA binding protein
MSNHVQSDNPNHVNLNDLISLQQAAEISGLSPDHLRRLVEKGEIWGKKIGRNWVTTAQAVTAYISRNIRPGRKMKKINP